MFRALKSVIGAFLQHFETLRFSNACFKFEIICLFSFLRYKDEVGALGQYTQQGSD